MLLRIVDYVASEAGGLRVSTQILTALISIRRDVVCEVVSWGRGLAAYRRCLSDAGDRVRIAAVKPRAAWRNGHGRVLNVPGSRRLIWSIGAQRFDFEIPDRALLGAEVIWMPWGNRHLLPDGAGDEVVATLHDIIPLECEATSTPQWRAAERRSLRRLISSSATIVTDSRATANSVARWFNARIDTMHVIPLADTHSREASSILPSDWEWSRGKFILCPANTAPHKNHEALFAGVSGWRRAMPLVLVGGGSDLKESRGRGAELSVLASRLGFVRGESLIPLGFVPDDLYWTLLNRSWAVVIPSLAEGSGLPLVEALVRGIPIVCSAVPAMREQAERLGAKVLWFDPRDPTDLTARLRELESRYDLYKQQAAAQVGQLQRRSWAEVAGEYWRLFETVASRRAETKTSPACQLQ